MRIQALHVAILVVAYAAIGQSPLAFAQVTYPAGPLRIVSPYAPGGGTDILGRIIGQKLNEALKQPVVVENRVGANGTIGAAYVAKAAPDGLTMLIVPAGYAANPALYKSLPYDQARDLAPVSHLASGPLVLVVHPSLPAKSVKEFIALAKSLPYDQALVQRGVGGIARRHDQHRESIRGCLGEIRGADGAVRADAVLDDDGLLQRLVQFLADDAAKDIGAAAGRIRRHDAQRG